MLRAFLSSFFIFFSTALLAQNITGKWEGRLNDEWLEINIQMKGPRICGFTYDYVLGSPANHCRAYFTATANQDGSYLLDGVSFIENSGSHVLMRIRLWFDPEYPGVLLGRVFEKPAPGSTINAFDADDVELTKTSSRPNMPGPGMPLCYNDPPPKPNPRAQAPKINPLPLPVPQGNGKKPVPGTSVPKAIPKGKPVPVPAKPKPVPVPKTIPARPVNPLPANPKPAKPVTKPPVKSQPPASVRRDTTAAINQPITAAKAKPPSLAAMPARKNTEISRLTVSVKKITLKLFDNGIVDNDTVSIYLNGRLLAGKKGLSETPITLEVELDQEINQITMYAENLGSIPPNTALVVITAGDKRYELHASASLKENALLVIEYKPNKYPPDN